MLWLYILLGIVLFFAIILAIPIKVCVQYKKQFFCRLRIGFVKIILYPPVPKKKKPKKKKKTEQPQKPAPKKEEKPNDNFLKELGLSGIVNLFTRITELAAGVLKDFFAHIIIKSFALSIKVGGKNAARQRLICPFRVILRPTHPSSFSVIFCRASSALSGLSAVRAKAP